MLKFFRLPFATTGDKTAVPDAVDTNGNVSYSQGYGFDYQRQKTDPAAKNIERDKMNQVFFDMTTAIAELQSQGVPDFITTALNGGAAYSYGQYAIVKYSGDLYISLVAANTALPSDTTKWALLPTPARIQGAYNIRASAAGTADALTAAFTPAVASLPAAPDTLLVVVRAGAANTSWAPTFKADGTTAKPIVKGSNAPLLPGDIAGAGHWLELQYDPTLDKWVLQNPAKDTRGSLKGLNSYNASATLPLADVGKLITFFGSTAGQTLTLPAANAVSVAGAGFWLVNQATVEVTISRAGADTINANTYVGSAIVNTLILNPGDSVFLSSNAALAWNSFGDVIATGSFTITGTGFAAAPTATATYKIIKGVVYLFIPTAAITGTSNATSFTLTGLPAAITPAQTKGLPLVLCVDAGNPTWGSVSVSNTGVISFNKTGLGASWTASGTKTLNVSEFIYQL